MKAKFEFVFDPQVVVSNEKTRRKLHTKIGHGGVELVTSTRDRITTVYAVESLPKAIKINSRFHHWEGGVFQRLSGHATQKAAIEWCERKLKHTPVKIGMGKLVPTAAAA